MSHQLKRLARRIPLGIARVGTVAHDGSGREPPPFCAPLILSSPLMAPRRRARSSPARRVAARARGLLRAAAAQARGAVLAQRLRAREHDVRERVLAEHAQHRGRRGLRPVLLVERPRCEPAGGQAGANAGGTRENVSRWHLVFPVGRMQRTPVSQVTASVNPQLSKLVQTPGFARQARSIDA